MKVETFYPKNTALRKYIEYYYFLRTDSADFQAKYYSFPNINHALNIHKNAVCNIGEHAINVSGNINGSNLLIVQGRSDSPLLVTLQGLLDKITIVFKPLGLNHFIENSFSSIAGSHSQVFVEWENNIFRNFLNSFFEASDYEKKIDILESYLVAICHPIKNEFLLETAIIQLINFDQEHSIDSIARSLKISTRSLNRLFIENLGITPICFKKIARFRNSLKNKIYYGKFKRLTEIAYDSNFYDQAYFIKIFNKLTGMNPSLFFQSVDKLADDNLIFNFSAE